MTAMPQTTRYTTPTHAPYAPAVNTFSSFFFKNINFICACSRENLFAAIFITQRAAAAAVPVAIDLPKCQAERERGLLFCVQSLDVGVHLIPLLTDCQMTRNSTVHCAVIFIYLFLFLVCLFV